MAATVHPLPADGPTVAEAVELYFDRVDLAASTRRKYRHTFQQLIDRHGDMPIGQVDPDQLTGLLMALAGDATGQTWNRHRAALGSLWGYAAKRGWAADVVAQGVERRKATVTRRGEQRLRTIPLPLLERLWSSERHDLRERALWRLAYDSAARADELLNLNVEDLDLDDRSAPVVGKGGDVRRIRWTTGTNRLLRHLIGGRSAGPLFVTARRPAGDVATADRCPETGRARLSYGRAWELFADATGRQWTLHQLRHTRLSHLGDDGVPTHLLRAVSGHRSLRSLEGYVHASDDAVKRLIDERDPDARRRTP